MRFLNQVQYTNAKVLLVGDSGVGKTGLSNYLALGVKDEERNIFAAERRLSVARRFQRRE